jgi:hypothetical protein
MTEYSVLFVAFMALVAVLAVCDTVAKVKGKR